MKKVIFFFLLTIFLFSFVSAVNIEVKKNVKQGENLIIKISGEFLTTLTKDNIAFYRRHLPTSFGFYDIEKIGGDYYVWVQIPEDKTPDNYSIALKDVSYYLGSKIINEEYQGGNFTILDEKASFSIKPGLLFYEENSKIEIQNLKPNKITIYKGYLEKKEIPEFNESDVNESEKTSFWDLFFKKEDYNSTDLFENDSLVVNDTRESFDLVSGEIKEIEIIPENYTGFQKIWFNYEDENYYAYLFIKEGTVIEIAENKTEINETNSSEVNNTIVEVKNKSEEPKKDIEIKTCDERGGFVCNSSSKCEGNLVDSKKSKCCLGECVLKEEVNTGKIVGWVLLVVVALFVTWFFKEKYRKPKKTPIDLEKESKKKK